MVRPGFTRLLIGCLLLASLGLSSPEPVRVFLRDGSFVQAQAIPEIREGRAYFRLHPGGMLAVLPADRIDFDATARAVEAALGERPMPAPDRVRGTVSGGSEGAAAAVQEARPAAPVPQEVPALELQHPEERALEERYAEEFTFLSERREAVQDALAALRSQESEIDRELRRSLSQPKLAGALADKLRGVQERLAARQEELRQVQTELEALLARAASRGVRLRRLPQVGGS